MSGLGCSCCGIFLCKDCKPGIIICKTRGCNRNVCVYCAQNIGINTYTKIKSIKKNQKIYECYHCEAGSKVLELLTNIILAQQKKKILVDVSMYINF